MKFEPALPAWSKPQFSRIGTIAQVARRNRMICGPDHAPTNPYCPHS